MTAADSRNPANEVTSPGIKQETPGGSRGLLLVVLVDVAQSSIATILFTHQWVVS